MSTRGTRIGWKVGEDSWEEMDKREIFKEKLRVSAVCMRKKRNRRCSRHLNSRDKSTEQALRMGRML